MSVASTEHFNLARKIVSAMTTKSWETIPHVCVTYEHDVSDFSLQIKDINANLSPDERITLNTALLKSITEGLKACPAMNAHIEFNEKLVRGCLTRYDNIDISMPTVLPDGSMMTINLHSMENKNLCEVRDTVNEAVRLAKNSDMEAVLNDAMIDNTVKELKKGKVVDMFWRLIGSKTGKHKLEPISRERKMRYIKEHDHLTKRDIEQGTVTVSNLGSLYRAWSGCCTILEIIPPQIVAIGISALQSRPTVNKDGEVVAGRILPITIAFDHRALDMGDIVPFMQKLDEIFENPVILKEWLN